MLIKKTNVTQQLVEYMREMIQTKRWKVGEKIPSETVLAKELSVSRASVHSAVQQFVALNILTSIQGKGTFLQSDRTEILGNRQIDVHSMNSILDLLHFRLIVEPEICFYAAEKTTREMTDKLQEYYNFMAASVGKNDTFTTYDIAFHRTISDILNNNFINSVTDMIYGNKDLLLTLNESYGYQGLHDHERLIKALSNHDGEAARKCMQKQLLDAISRLSI